MADNSPKTLAEIRAKAEKGLFPDPTKSPELKKFEGKAHGRRCISKFNSQWLKLKSKSQPEETP
jgi:hypothetical protein